MSWVHRIRASFQKQELEENLEDELQFHIEMRVKELVATGMSPEEAHHKAACLFGNQMLLKEKTRDMDTIDWIHNAVRDLRYAVRMLRKSPVFASVTVLVMALGIGANTAVFSVVNTVLLRPLPYRDPDRILTLASRWKDGGQGPVSAPDFHDWHDQSTAFSAMAYYKPDDTAATSGAAAEYANVASVTAEFFRVVGTEPVVGRLFTAEESKPGSAGAVVVSYQYSQTHFGVSTSALGHTIRIYDKTLSIVGVLPRRFHFPDKTDIWFPANTIFPEVDSRGGHNYRAIGRLKSNVSLEEAQAEMTLI